MKTVPARRPPSSPQPADDMRAEYNFYELHEHPRGKYAARYAHGPVRLPAKRRNIFSNLWNAILALGSRIRAIASVVIAPAHPPRRKH